MDWLSIDGSYGEGGGQLLRTALTLSALGARPIKLHHIRAGRAKPGLAAQHLTAVRAIAALSDAELSGAALGSQTLTVRPRAAVRAGNYEIDVGAARAGGSAGAVALVAQTVLLPLALAGGPSKLVLRGGTHVPASPTVDYLQDVWLPTLHPMGVRAALTLRRSGWYPVGQGELELTVEGTRGEAAALTPLRARERGALLRVTGTARTANLPEHIGERMAARANDQLAKAGLRSQIAQARDQAACPGASLLLVAEYEAGRGGYIALGKRGKPAEAVADEAVAALLAHRDSGAAYEEHLSDQLILPAALASGPSSWSASRITRHLLTNAWVVARFGAAQIDPVPNTEGVPGVVTVRPRPFTTRQPARPEVPSK